MLKYDKPLKNTISLEKVEPEESPAEQKLEKRGENVAFAVESVITCWATDFIDPVISYFIQKKHAEKHGGAHGSGMQNIVGEVGGDILGAVALLGVQAIAPNQMEAVGKSVGNMLDPLYRRMAQKSIHVNFDKPEDVKRYEEWRSYQQDNLTKMGVLSVASIAGNVAVQKTPWVANPSPAHVIGVSKIGGAAITAGVVLGWRTLFPATSRKVDEWLSRHAFAPILKHTDRLMGYKDQEEKPAATPSGVTNATSWQTRAAEPSIGPGMRA